MTKIPIGSSAQVGSAFGFKDPIAGSPGWTSHDGTAPPSLFAGAQMMVDWWGFTREDLEVYSLEIPSPRRAQRHSWAASSEKSRR